MRKWVLLPVLMIFSLFLVDSVQGAILINGTTHLLDDAYMDSSAPSLNTGAYTEVALRDRATVNRDGWWKFNITDADIGDEVEDAQVCIFHYSVTGVASDDGATVYLYASDNDTWDESTITWATKPSHEGTAESSVALTRDQWGYQYICWDITDEFPEHLAGNGGNNLFSFELDSVRINDGLDNRFRSKEAGNSSEDAYILVSFGGDVGSGEVYEGFVPAPPLDSIEINDCGFNITTSGTPDDYQWYHLSQSIASDDDYALSTTSDHCIFVNASNVFLSLNGYRMFDTAGISTGVLIDGGSSNENENIIVSYGVIEDYDSVHEDVDSQDYVTGGVWVDNISNVEISNMVFIDNQIGIRLFDTDDATIEDVEMRGADCQAGLYADGGQIENLMFDGNDFSDIECNYGLKVDNGYLGRVTGSEIGYVGQPEQCCTELTVYVFGIPITQYTDCLEDCWLIDSTSPKVAMNLDACSNMTVDGNFMYGSSGTTLTGDSFHNEFIYNSFVKTPNEVINGLFLSSDTYNNTGCGNYGGFFDSGTDNDFDDACLPDVTGGVIVINEGYYCSDSDTIVQLASDGTVIDTIDCGLADCISSSNNSYCEGSAVGEEGVGTTIDTTDYIFEFDDTTIQDLEEAGIDWILFFLTKFFIFSIIMLVVAGGFSYLIPDSAKVIFPIVITLFSAGYTLTGIYPFAVGLVIVIVAGFIAVKMLGETFGIGR